MSKPFLNWELNRPIWQLCFLWEMAKYNKTSHALLLRENFAYVLIDVHPFNQMCNFQREPAGINQCVLD